MKRKQAKSKSKKVQKRAYKPRLSDSYYHLVIDDRHTLAEMPVPAVKKFDRLAGAIAQSMSRHNDLINASKPKTAAKVEAKFLRSIDKMNSFLDKSIDKARAARQAGKELKTGKTTWTPRSLAQACEPKTRVKAAKKASKKAVKATKKTKAGRKPLPKAKGKRTRKNVHPDSKTPAQRKVKSVLKIGLDTVKKIATKKAA